MNPQISTIGSPVFAPVTPTSVCPPPAFSGVVLRHLKTRAEIEDVLHLREEIDLSVHTASGPEFIALEKKETSAVLSSALSSTAKQ